MPSPLRFSARASVVFSPRLALDRASGRRIDEDGHMHVASNVISAAQINPYYGSELDGDGKLGLQPDRVFQILRDPTELERGATTFAGKPLQIEHRQQSADDHKAALVVGSISNPKWVAPNLLAELTIWDKNAIKAVQNGTQASLSCGYWFDLDMTAGSYQGRPYDGRFTNIRGNHVSLVPDGRVAGAAVGDASIKPRRIRMASDDNGEDSARDRLLTFLAGRLSGSAMLKVISIIDGTDSDDDGEEDSDANLAAADRAIRKLAADRKMRRAVSDAEQRSKLFPHSNRLR